MLSEVFNCSELLGVFDLLEMYNVYLLFVMVLAKKNFCKYILCGLFLNRNVVRKFLVRGNESV